MMCKGRDGTEAEGIPAWLPFEGCAVGPPPVHTALCVCYSPAETEGSPQYRHRKVEGLGHATRGPEPTSVGEPGYFLSPVP